MSEIINKKIQQIKQAFEVELSSPMTKFIYKTLKDKYLGRKGLIRGVYEDIVWSTLSNTEKAMIEQAISNLKTYITAAVTPYIKLDEPATLPQNIDFTLPSDGNLVGSMHPISLTIKSITDFFYQLGFQDMKDMPELDNSQYNFELLNVAINHPARNTTDTFYLDDTKIMRTHTTCGSVKALETHAMPIRVLTYGPTHRRDNDRTHTPTFHQLDGIIVDPNFNWLDGVHLLGQAVKRFLGQDVSLRIRPTYFPFTEPSAEIDVGIGNQWVEILGFGMLRPNIINRAFQLNNQINKTSKEHYQAFAFGMGIERMVMLKYALPDLRILYNNDLRFLRQFSRSTLYEG